MNTQRWLITWHQPAQWQVAACIMAFIMNVNNNGIILTELNTLIIIILSGDDGDGWLDAISDMSYTRDTVQF